MSEFSLIPKSGPKGFCSIVPKDGTLSVSGSAPEVTRTYASVGSNIWPDAKLRLASVSRGFTLSMGWETKGEAQVLLRTLGNAWPGLGYRVGPYPGRIFVPDQTVVRAEGTIEGGVQLDIGQGDPAFGGRIFHLTADLAWSCALGLGVGVPSEDALQDWGSVAMPCYINFYASRSSGYVNEAGDPFMIFTGGYDVPYYGIEDGYSHQIDPVLVPVEYERGWSNYYPGHFLQGFAGSRF